MNIATSNACIQNIFLLLSEQSLDNLNKKFNFIGTTKKKFIVNLDSISFLCLIAKPNEVVILAFKYMSYDMNYGLLPSEKFIVNKIVNQISDSGSYI